MSRGFEGRLTRLEGIGRGQRLPKGCRSHHEWMARLGRARSLWRQQHKGEITEAEYQERSAALGPLFPDPTEAEKQEADRRREDILQAFRVASAREAERQREIEEAHGKHQAVTERYQAERPLPMIVERPRPAKQQQPQRPAVDRLAGYRGSAEEFDPSAPYLQQD